MRPCPIITAAMRGRSVSVGPLRVRRGCLFRRGVGILRPSFRAVRIHRSLAGLSSLRASSSSFPNAEHPGSSGATAMKPSSSSLYLMDIEYRCILSIIDHRSGGTSIFRLRRPTATGSFPRSLVHSSPRPLVHSSAVSCPPFVTAAASRLAPVRPGPAGGPALPAPSARWAPGACGASGG